MNHLRIEILTKVDFEEVSVGHINVYQIPKVGENLWFSTKRLGYSSWLVKEVFHHVGDGKFINYPKVNQNVVIYAVPTSI